MKKPRFLTILIPAVALLGLAGLLLFSPEVKISLQLSESAPLSASARIETREPTRVELTIPGKDGNDLTASFEAFSRTHDIPVLGLYPDTDNRVAFRMETRSGEVFTRTLTIETDPLPDVYPEFRIQRLVPEKIAPGMIFMHLGYYNADGDFQPITSAIDNYGKVRWYYIGEIGHVLERLDNGNLLIQRNEEGTGKGNFHGPGGPADRLIEINMLGGEVRTRAQVQTGLHHDAVVMPDGNILALSSAPGSYDDGVVEIDGETGEVIRGWDLREIVDPDRPPQPRNLAVEDWLHLNGIDYNPADDSFILSARDQSAVIKVDRGSGELRWILGNHDNWGSEFRPYLLTPRADQTLGEAPFTWPWGQHAPMFHPDDPSRIILYDNGNERSYTDPIPVEENFSRAAEYRINEETMEVTQIWEFGRRYGAELFTPFIGDADYLPGGNRLICFGGITRSLEGEAMEIFDFEAGTINRMKISAHIIETTSSMPAEEVLHITIEDTDPQTYTGYRSYRAVKMPLYPEPKGY